MIGGTSQPLDPAVLQQMLHRALGMVSAAALGVVIILNWFIAHLATSWAMPSEVQSAMQTLITTAATLWIFRRYGLAALRGESGALVDGTLPVQPPGNGGTKLVAVPAPNTVVPPKPLGAT